MDQSQREAAEPTVSDSSEGNVLFRYLCSLTDTQRVLLTTLKAFPRAFWGKMIISSTEQGRHEVKMFAEVLFLFLPLFLPSISFGSDDQWSRSVATTYRWNANSAYLKKEKRKKKKEEEDNTHTHTHTNKKIKNNTVVTLQPAVDVIADLSTSFVYLPVNNIGYIRIKHSICSNTMR